MTTMHAGHSPRLVPFALTADDVAAHHWLEALEEAGIPAELHIEDGSRLVTGSSVFPTGQIFANAIYIAPDCRDRAAAVLIDLGWDGRQLGGGRPTGRPRKDWLVAGGAVGVALLGLTLTVALRGL